MNARATLRWIAASVAVIVVVAFVLDHRRSTPAANRPAPQEITTKPDAKHRKLSSSDATIDSRLDTMPIDARSIDAPSRDAVMRDPDAAAGQWYARASRVVDAKWRKELGDDVGKLMSVPWDQAIPALRARASDGDDAAAGAIAMIQMICRTEATRAPPTSNRADDAPRWNHLSPAWVAFADRLHARHDVEHAERMTHCPDDASTMDLVGELVDRFLRPDNPEARIAIAAENADGAQAIADLRQLIADGAGPRAEFYLADRLLAGADPAGQVEGLAMFERLASDNPAIAARLGYCLESGCDHFVARPGEAMPWIEQAAGNGDELAYSMLMTQLDGSGDATGAWAWSLFRLDLAMSGCLETIGPNERYVANAADDEARRRATLSPAQQNAGLARYYEISGRWEKKAREQLSCAG